MFFLIVVLTLAFTNDLGVYYVREEHASPSKSSSLWYYLHLMQISHLHQSLLEQHLGTT